MVKTVSGNTDLELQAEANESFRITDIMVSSPSSNYISVYVDKVLVAYYRVGGNLGNHLNFPLQDEENSSLLGKLIDMGVFRPIPVPKGSKVKITGVAQAGSLQVIVYDEYDENDVRPTEPNGTDSREYDYINYGRYSGTLASGDNLYSVQQTSNQFPAFPFGDVVPAGRNITLHGIVATDVGLNDGANEQNTQYLKMVRNRKVLFDEDLNGLPFFGSIPATATTNFGLGQSIIGNYTDVDQRLMYLFPEPLTYSPGEDLDVYVNTAIAAGSAALSASDCEVGFIASVTELR